MPISMKRCIKARQQAIKNGLLRVSSLKQLVKPRVSVIVTPNLNVTITDNTRQADVLLKLVQSGESGISANDIDKGVHLSGLIRNLKGKGIPITTTRERVANDPFGAIRAVYRTTVTSIDKVQP